MNHFEIEARTAKQAEVANTQALRRKPVGALPENLEGTSIDNVEAVSKSFLPSPPPRPAGRAAETARPEAQPPYIMQVEVNCDECGGSGFDPGGIDPWGPEVCPTCHGSKTQKITRNYLAEAFQIAANPESTRTVERQHLVAVIQHCRQAVSALVSLPEVA